jgi:DNA polymerase I-like protein with 3'-5' exonuclease and polymerase domains
VKTKAPPVITIDFETHGIEARPKYPPKPASLALKWPDQREYLTMAWGHGDGSKAAGNNCTEKEARAAYKKARDSKYGLLFQDGMFDTDVAETHWEVPLKDDPRQTHDTMFLLFLHDPHAPSLALKESAHRLLGIPPDEQDDLKAWILANVPEARRKPSTWGAYICRAPYQIVRPYHKGDLTRTGGLFDHLWPKIAGAGMLEAYQREQRLMPILLRNARRGMRIDVDRLDRDIPVLKAGMEKAEGWLRKRLGDINMNSNKQLADALFDKGIVREFKLTPKGQRGVGTKQLTIDMFSDKKVYQVMTYLAQMETSIGTFMEPWRELAGEGNRIFPVWKQVKSSGAGGGDQGARSGRIICSKPNLLNLPKKWKKSAALGYAHPAWLKVPELPFIRTYALPDKGKRWGRRDIVQQEVMLFSYFEEGPVMQGFLEDYGFDMHEVVRAEVERQLVEAGLRDSFDRDSAKGVVFARLYGQGLAGLMQLLNLSEDERHVAQVIQRAVNAAIPSIKELDTALKEIGKSGAPIKTLGGRLYYVEESKYVEKFGRNMDFSYKLLNYLCQGSGADFTKEVVCRYYESGQRTEDMITTVYDEIDINLPLSDKGARHEMRVLKDCISSVDIKPLVMQSEGEVGPSWGQLEKFTV